MAVIALLGEDEAIKAPTKPAVVAFVRVPDGTRASVDATADCEPGRIRRPVPSDGNARVRRNAEVQCREPSSTTRSALHLLQDRPR